MEEQRPEEPDLTETWEAEKIGDKDLGEAVGQGDEDKAETERWEEEKGGSAEERQQ